jgi:ribonuclease HI
MNLLVWTDGSCSSRDRVGGYAWKVVDEWDNEVMGGGSEVDTTISRMELMGAIGALAHCFVHWGSSVILLHSDSEYVVKGFMDQQRKRNKNVDLWIELEGEAAKHEVVVMQHTRGHAGQRDNEDCDKLAGEFRQAALRSNDNSG